MREKERVREREGERERERKRERERERIWNKIFMFISIKNKNLASCPYFDFA